MAIPFLTLTVKGPPGLTFPLIVSPELTVRELKEEVHRLKGESPDSIEVIYRGEMHAGQILSDASVLRDLELRPGDSLWLVICIKAVKRGKQESSAPGKSELPLPELTIIKPKEVLQSSMSLPMPPIVPARVSQASEIQIPLNPMRPSEGVDSRTLPLNLKREPLPAGANPPANEPLPLPQPSKPNQSGADAPINPMQVATPPSSARSPMAQQMAQMQLSAVGLQPTPEFTNVYLDMVASQPYQNFIQQACVDPQLYKSLLYMNPMSSESKEFMDAICANPEAIRAFQQFTSHMFSEMAKPAAELTTSTSSAQSNTPTAVPPTSNVFALFQEMGFTDREANLKAWLEAEGDMSEAISILQRLEK